jgi:hypothetical protein
MIHWIATSFDGQVKRALNVLRKKVTKSNADLNPKVNNSLAELRKKVIRGNIQSEIRFLSGVTLRADPALKIQGSYDSPEGRLLTLDITPQAQGDWVALHLSLDSGDYTPHGFVGFACRIAAPEPVIIHPCLRSGTKESFIDSFFNKHILATPEEASHLDALPIHNRSDLPLHAPWRELVLFLPTERFRWSLHDLRVFVV